MRALLASPLGLLIGVSLGALGGGGSILAVPALVYAAGQTPKQATTTSLVLVAVTALIGIIPHWRAHRVRFGAGTSSASSASPARSLGSRWNQAANPDLLLLAFAGLMFVAATAMWRRARRPASPTLARSSERRRRPRSARARSAIRPRHGCSESPRPAPSSGSSPGSSASAADSSSSPRSCSRSASRCPRPSARRCWSSRSTPSSRSAPASKAGAIEWGTVIPFTIASLLGVVIGTRLASTKDSTVTAAMVRRPARRRRHLHRRAIRPRPAVNEATPDPRYPPGYTNGNHAVSRRGLRRSAQPAPASRGAAAWRAAPDRGGRRLQEGVDPTQRRPGGLAADRAAADGRRHALLPRRPRASREPRA